MASELEWPDNPICVALDVQTAEEAARLARSVAEHVGAFKVGLELIMGPGPQVLGSIHDLGRPLFVDAKLHDIPNTVHRAARNLGRYGVRWLTVHASGGRDMIEAGVQGIESAGGGGVLAVTTLTSMDRGDLAAVGVDRSVGAHSARLAKLAAGAGAEGVVCSVKELSDIGQAAPGMRRVTPGIRSSGGNVHDQVRVSTPRQALEYGSDMLVVGRPITRADDPSAAAAALSEEALKD